MTDSIETRVARGVALLDRTLADWDERIDLERLNLENTCDCILGQEFARHPDVDLAEHDGWFEVTPFDIGVRELFSEQYFADPELAARAHGFNAIGKPGHTVKEFQALTAEWRRVVLARRGGAS